MTELVLATQNITKSFGSLIACDKVSIELKAREIHAIIGPNGAGKSTLISQICGTQKPDSGRVELLGQDITSKSAKDRALAGLGRTFQISQLAMEDTVLQNVMLGSLGKTGNPWKFIKPILTINELRDQAENALERVGLIDDINYETGTLSHGKKRQLEVAIALTLKPKVFIMDEPMAGLGIEGSKELTLLLDNLRNEAPILLVEHDMDAVFALADKISVLDYGRVIASDSVEGIKKNPIVQRAYLGEEA
jgi:branched-chain amino acid transport system ATP-binding protein